MSPRSRRAVSKPPPEPPGERPREALLAALAERERELAEAREQQAAVAEVLQVINAAPGELTTVFDAIVEKGARLCDATNGALWLAENGIARLASLRSVKARSLPKPVPLFDLVGRGALDRSFLHIEDLKATRAYQKRVPLIVASVDAEGARTCLVTPLHDDGKVVGVFALYRDEVRPFTERQIALAQAFAGQAQIAMKNARLMNDTQEALERQTATADILKVIASSPSDVQPVFEAIAATAKRLLGGHSCAVGRIADDRMQLEAFTPTNPAGDAVMKAYYPRPYKPEESRAAQSIARQGFAEMADVEAEADEALRDYARARGFRGFVTVPLTADADQIGWITVTREEPGRFAPHHIRLLQTFADQAVIAIQNARLFDAVQAKTRDLEESLRQQTATSEVLKVISRSTFDLDAVLTTLVEFGSLALRCANGLDFNAGRRSPAVGEAVGLSRRVGALAARQPDSG